MRGSELVIGLGLETFSYGQEVWPLCRGCEEPQEVRRGGAPGAWSGGAAPALLLAGQRGRPEQRLPRPRPAPPDCPQKAPDAARTGLPDIRAQSTSSTLVLAALPGLSWHPSPLLGRRPGVSAGWPGLLVCSLHSSCGTSGCPCRGKSPADTVPAAGGRPGWGEGCAWHQAGGWGPVTVLRLRATRLEATGAVFPRQPRPAGGFLPGPRLASCGLGRGRAQS